MKKQENDIPIIEYGYDEDKDETFTMVAYTATPAIKSKGYAFSDTEKVELKKYYFNDEKQVVIAPLMIPYVDMKPRWDYIDNELVYHKPIFTDIGIEKMYKNFMRKLSTTRIFNNEHDDTIRPSYFYEIWRKESMTADKSAAYGLNHPIGTVYMMSQIEDKNYWNQIKMSGADGFSIEGHLGTKLFRFSDSDIMFDLLSDISEDELVNKLNSFEKQLEQINKGTI